MTTTSSDEDLRLAWWDAGYQVGIQVVATDGDAPLPAELIARRTMDIIARRRETDAKWRKLDAAEAEGPEAYAAERARQGLVAYGQPWEIDS